MERPEDSVVDVTLCQGHRRPAREGEHTVDDTRAELPATSLGVLLDNARTAIAAAREAGLTVDKISVSPVDLELVRTSKKFEERVGLPLRILGVAIEADGEVAVGSVRL